MTGPFRRALPMWRSYEPQRGRSPSPGAPRSLRNGGGLGRPDGPGRVRRLRGRTLDREERDRPVAERPDEHREQHGADAHVPAERPADPEHNHFDARAPDPAPPPRAPLRAGPQPATRAGPAAAADVQPGRLGEDEKAGR